MLGHAILLIATQIAFETIKTSSALQIRDITGFVEKLKQDEEKYKDATNERARDHERKDYITLNSRQLDQLIDLVANGIYNQDRSAISDLTGNHRELTSYEFGNLHNRNSEQFHSSNSQRGNQILNEVVWSKLEDNSIDPSYDSGSIVNNDDYKLYVVLNPRTNLNDKDFKDISGLLSQMLPDSGSKRIISNQDHTRMKESARYKGFLFADGRRSRRRPRESKELYAEPNSVEDFKPKRSRADFGAGGRTPIPYIRHRDIYERE